MRPNESTRIKAIKSEEEMILIRRCAEMQDEIFARVCKKIKPGMRDNDITALAQYEGRLLGSEQGCFSARRRRSVRPRTSSTAIMQGRVLQEGEHFSLLIENAGPGGMYTEIARTMVLGKASNELIDGFETVKEAQTHTLSMIKPGVPARDIARAYDEFMARARLRRREAPLCPWPGLRPGRAAADPRGRDHDDRGRHESRGASGL